MLQKNFVESQADLAPTFVAPKFYALRFDVLVHLLALQQLAGRGQVDIDLTSGAELGQPLNPIGQPQRSESAVQFFTSVQAPDWVAHSAEFSLEDKEPTVADRLRSTSAVGSELVIGFSHGGVMLTGAVDAAVAMHRRTEATRVTTTSRGVDRSISALRNAGWSHGDLRSLLHAWTVADPESAVVILDATHGQFDDASYELRCRFEQMHSEVDFISSPERKELKLSGQGSVQTLFMRGSGNVIADVLESHRDVVLGSFLGDFSVVPLTVLWSPARPAASDALHERRLRQLRVGALKEQAVTRLRRTEVS